MWAIFTYDIRNWMRIGTLWRLFGTCTAAAAATALAVWPTTHRIVFAMPPESTRWYTSAQFLMLTYVALMLGADAFPWHDEAAARPHQWVEHELAHPGHVVAARTAAVMTVIAGIVVLSMPMIAFAVFPFVDNPGQWVVPLIVTVVAVVFWVALGMVANGLWARRRHRFVAAQTAYFSFAAFMLVSGFKQFRHPGVVLNPLYVIDRSTRRLPFDNPAAATVPWPTHVLAYAIIIAVIVFVVAVVFRRTIESSSSSSKESVP